jgi:hypothetical protein
MKVEAVGFSDSLVSIYQQPAVPETESLHAICMETIPMNKLHLFRRTQHSFILIQQVRKLQYKNLKEDRIFPFRLLFYLME